MRNVNDVPGLNWGLFCGGLASVWARALGGRGLYWGLVLRQLVGFQGRGGERCFASERVSALCSYQLWDVLGLGGETRVRTMP